MNLKRFFMMGCMVLAMGLIASCSNGEDGANGINGDDGVGIVSTVDNGDGTFTINYSDGTSFITNDLTGATGAAGENCWDAVGDVNDDGETNSLDCVGEPGSNGEDGVLITTFFFEDFEGLPDTTPPVEFVQSETNNANWYVDTRQFISGSLNNNDAVVSGGIADNETTEISISFTNEATSLIEFDVLVSTENGFDFFTWSLNGVEIQGVSGILGDPLKVRVTAPAGDNALTFTYSKDESLFGGSDEVAVDNLLINNISSVGKVNTNLPTLPEGATYFTDRGNKTK